MIQFDESPQGSEAWLAARRGAITGSRAKDTRAFKKNGESTSERLAYAMDKARERLGGMAAPVFQNAAMRIGTTEEPEARKRYEFDTGYLVREVGFAYTEDHKFGCSVDGLIGDDGVWECKTMVSSNTLFKAMVDGDISDYRDQCLFAMWLLNRKWVDLTLWCPDLQALHVIRIQRDEDEIQKLEDDLVTFERLVSGYESALRAKLSPPADPPWQTEAPSPTTQAQPLPAGAELFA
jgi:exodeoxyribonuclease (lambda-induced)